MIFIYLEQFLIINLEMKTYLFLLLFSTQIFVFGQKDNGNKSIAFPKIENNLEIKPVLTSPKRDGYSINEPFNPALFKVPTKKYGALKMEKPIVITPEISDLKPGRNFEKKLNKSFKNIESDYVDGKIFRRDMFFGQYITKSPTLTINYRDYGNVDGDQIKIVLNNNVVFNIDNIEYDFKKQEIKLVEGLNYLEIIALNEGLYLPNTGQFKIDEINGKSLIEDYWYVGTGFKAIFVILKE